MSKSGYFFKSIVAFLIALLLMFLATIPTMIIFALRTMADPANTQDIFTIIFSLQNSTELSQISNIVYGIVAFVVFIVWYHKVFVRPFRNRKRNIPGGYSFHTIMSFLILALGMQLVSNLIADTVGKINPQWLVNYNSLIQNAGYDDASVYVILYSVILAPIVEELLFRGLIFRYARHALPFWLANIFQAFLFGLMHMNIIQGAYSFLFGLLLGWICHRGRGIRYSIPVHICFNALGIFASSILSLLINYRYHLFTGLGIALVIFGIWLFYTDFLTEKVPEDKARDEEEPVDDEDDRFYDEDDEFYEDAARDYYSDEEK